MSSSDDEGKDADLVAIAENMVSIGLGLAIDGHQLHAAVLAVGEVQLVQELGQRGAIGQSCHSLASGLLRQEATEA